MANKSENILIKIVSNVIIGIVILTIVFVGFANEIASVFDKSYDKPFYNGDTSKAQVSIMINVYWGTEYIDSMLATLDKYNAKATFFIGGTWADKNRDVLLKIIEHGHEIGNHGYFHKDSKNISYSQVRDEIVNCAKMVYNIASLQMNLFAPPSGSFNNTTLQAATELGYKTIMWSKDTIDWRDQDAELIFKRATNKLANGDLVLMHPTAKTAEALERILKFYIASTFKIVTVSTNIAQG